MMMMKKKSNQNTNRQIKSHTYTRLNNEQCQEQPEEAHNVGFFYVEQSSIVYLYYFLGMLYPSYMGYPTDGAHIA